MVQGSLCFLFAIIRVVPGLLFAIPVAILAAICTSEFVHYRLRSTIKPTMEMMASLPSVILGFVAALVLAPVVESWIAAVIFAFVAFPVSLMLAAYLWQLLPLHIAVRLEGIPKFGLISLVVVTSLSVAYKVGPLVRVSLVPGGFQGMGQRGCRRAGTVLASPVSARQRVVCAPGLEPESRLARRV